MRGDINTIYRPARVESALWACVGVVMGMVGGALTVLSLLNGGHA
mgnify:CR=1 FL=1